MSNAARTLAFLTQDRESRTNVASIPEPASGVHRRVVPGTGVESFSSWVNEQLVAKSEQASPPSEEIQSHEDAMLAALQRRDIPAALMHACAIVYLDPGHKAAQRIKRRCMRAMRPRRAPDGW